MKKLLAALALLCLTASLALGGNKVIKVGVFQPLSGDNGANGKQEALGIQYAHMLKPTVEIGGETYDIKLVYADNASSTDKAPSAAMYLVSEQVSVVVGSNSSGVSIAGSPYFGAAGIPVVGATCTNPQVTLGNTHYFRICFLDPFQGIVLANYAYKQMNARTAYCLGELGNDYDVGLIHYFQDAFEALGGKVIFDTFPTGTSDFTSYISNAANYGADVFFFPVCIAYSTQILAQIASTGCDIPLLGSDIEDSNKVLEVLKGTDVDLVISTFYQEGVTEEFDSGFRNWLNSDHRAKTNNGGNDIITAGSAMGFDAYNVAMKAVEAANSTDPAKINAALWNVTHDGVCGRVAFDKNGDAVRDSAILKKVDTKTGRWKFVAIQKVD